MKWFKFYGQDWLTDLKIRKMPIEDRLCFITLLCLASSQEEEGLIKDCDEHTLIELTGLYNDPYETNNQYTRAIGCLKRYEALHCVTLHDNGDVTLLNFMRRQEENLSNAERQQKYRERLKTKTKSRNERYVTKSNDSNARIDKNRIDKNRDNILLGDSVPFDSFWNLYPKKVGKRKAQEFWLKLPLVDQTKAIADIPMRKQDQKWIGGFIKDPERYIKYKQWEDEIIPEKVKEIKKVKVDKI